jgi:3',5'-cyclic AMP phosphodiesterase CpdA
LIALVLTLVGCRSDQVRFAEARPFVPADPARVRFVALGDAGRGDPGQRRVAKGVVRACAERGCDAILLLGDLVYPRGMESDDDPHAEAWIADPYTPAGVPIYLVLGNHDYGRGRDVEPARRTVAWAKGRTDVVLPAEVWQVRVGIVHLFGLDTNAAMEFGEDAQLAWLKKGLEASDAPWKVVLGHHPFRSNGDHGNAGSYEGWSHVPIVSGDALRHLFEDGLCGKADLYLAGHDHNRQLLDHCGVQLVVSGGGSATTPISDRGNEPLFASSEPGSAWFELGPGAGRVVFLDADGNADAELPLTPDRAPP